MDLGAIIGFISSIVTLEEAGRNWIPMIKEYKNGIESRSYVPFCLDTDNESVRYAIDKFEANVYSQYKNYLFNEDDFNTIIAGFLSKIRYLNLSTEDKALLKDCIKKILIKYNDDTRSNMSLGEQVIWEKIDKNSEVLSTIDRNVIELAHDKQNNKSGSKGCWINNAEIQKRGEKIVKDNHLKNFLLGNRYNCNLWGLVFQGKTVRRDIVNLVLEKV